MNGIKKMSLATGLHPLQIDDNEDAIINGASKKGTTIHSESPCVVAVIEGRGAASDIGIASFNTDTAECSVGQIADTSGYSRTLTFLHVHPPSQIVICAQSEGAQSISKLILVLNDAFGPQRLTTWPRKTFNETIGAQLIQLLCLPELMPSVMTGIAKK